MSQETNRRNLFGRWRKQHRNLGVITMMLSVVAITALAAGLLPNRLNSPDNFGVLGTFGTKGGIDLSNPFFQNLGTNGRTCGSCHVSSTAWTISPPEVQERFQRTEGTDPIFRTVDGANCPSANVATLEERAESYSLLLHRGLIRISIPVPTNADFQITNIFDPFHCRETTQTKPAMYRRPLPATNLPFLTTVMWDGRESPKGRSMNANLTQQAIDATTGHAQGTTPTPQQLQDIVAFETALFTSQSETQGAGMLTAHGAKGGPVNLSQQKFYVGINDVLGADPTGAPFNPVAFTLYNEWLNSPDPYRASIAHGEVLFNTLPITITGVAGLNDLPGLQTVNGFCTTCHDTPNVGNHSLPLAINIGITDFPALPALDVSDLPVYSIQCSDGTRKQTTDPARALITGKCADVGKTKGPILRGLAARAPYFHNGSAATLNDVVEFYNQRFVLNLTEEQKRDLVAFLQTL
jgi:hypothetical protein